MQSSNTEESGGMFLTNEQVAELSGIKAGRAGKSRATRQSEELKRMGIPHYVNAINRVIVVRAVIEGRKDVRPAPPPRWEPGVLTG